MILPWLEIPFKSDIFLADQFSHIEKPSQSSRIKKKKAMYFSSMTIYQYLCQWALRVLCSSNIELLLKI